MKFRLPIIHLYIVVAKVRLSGMSFLTSKIGADIYSIAISIK